jgi:hypothetical protein
VTHRPLFTAQARKVLKVLMNSPASLAPLGHSNKPLPGQRSHFLEHFLFLVRLKLTKEDLAVGLNLRQQEKSSVQSGNRCGVHQVDLLSREPPDADGPVSLKTEPSRPTRLDGIEL